MTSDDARASPGLVKSVIKKNTSRAATPLLLTRHSFAHCRLTPFSIPKPDPDPGFRLFFFRGSPSASVLGIHLFPNWSLSPAQPDDVTKPDTNRASSPSARRSRSDVTGHYSSDPETRSRPRSPIVPVSGFAVGVGIGNPSFPQLATKPDEVRASPLVTEAISPLSFLNTLPHWLCYPENTPSTNRLPPAP